MSGSREEGKGLLRASDPSLLPLRHSPHSRQAWSGDGLLAGRVSGPVMTSVIVP